MRLIKTCQRETLIYWAPTDPSPFGEPQWCAPVEMTCRWDDKLQEIQSTSGTRVVSRVEIISQEKLKVGGFVYRGSMSDLLYPDSPSCNEDTYEVLKVAETPTIRYNARLYEAWA